MRKQSKRLLSLCLAVVMCLGILTVPANAKTTDEPPELPLADVAVPVTVAEGRQQECDLYDYVRISHVIAQETVTCDGEPMELYSIYPYVAVWKTGGYQSRGTYAAVRAYAATLEDGVLKSGELVYELEPDPPSDSCWLYWNEEGIGNYFIVEISESYYSAKLGIHVVEGTPPDFVPVWYVNDVGLSHEAQSTEGVFAVPAGTVATLPYNKADGDGDWLCSTSVWSMEVAPYSTWEVAKEAMGGKASERVEPYMCNGRECFTVEPGRIYHINYCQSVINNIDGFIEAGFNEAHIYIVGEEAAPTAVETTQTVNVDGKDVTFYTYALVNEDGGLTNYAKLRDVAAVLNGTKAQFEVGWNGVVNLETGKPYTVAGGEMEKTFEGDQPYVAGNTLVNVNGVPADLQAITLVDEKGGNYNYFELRKLGQALGFNVGWSKAKGIFIETDKPYDPNN